MNMRKTSLVRRLGGILVTPLRAIGAQPLLSLLFIAAIVLISLFFVGLNAIEPDTKGKQVPLTAAIGEITDGHVNNAVLADQDARILLETSDNGPLWASYPHSDAYTTSLLGRLNKAKVSTRVDQQTGKPYLKAVVQFLLPILILVTLFAMFTLLARDKGGAAFAAFSRWTGRRQKGGSGVVSFRDVAGAPEALIELREIVDYLENPGRYAQLGARAPKGVLLTGPPGTGKTLLARAVAGEATANFFSLSGSEFVESLVGVGAARVRDLFRQARRAAPAIIFIDELDGVGRQRGAGMGQGHDEREQTLNQMLVEMDGFSAESGVVVMAATNRPDILDNALLRPGRFDRQVVVDLPDISGRTEILALHARKAPLAEEVELERIAAQTPGFTGADLANLINEASLLAVRAGSPKIGQIELEEAVDRVLSGPERKSHILSEPERRRIAVHEAGHAIVAWAIDNPVALQKLSIVARGRGQGGSTLYAAADKLVLSHLDLTKGLVTMMAGAAAEDLVFAQLSTGVEDDLHEATRVAHAMVVSYGMSPEIGPVAIGEKQGEVFIGRDLANLSNVAPATLELVDAEVRRTVREAEETGRHILKRNRPLLDELAGQLLERETLSGPSLDVYREAVEHWTTPLLPALQTHGDADTERLQ
jgi:cell division protease FtsH